MTQFRLNHCVCLWLLACGRTQVVEVPPAIDSGRAPHVVAAHPEPTSPAEAAWSEDGRWIAWKGGSDLVAVARTTDLVPVRKVKSLDRADFIGNWLLLYHPSTASVALERPEDGVGIAVASSGTIDMFAVTRSFVTVLDRVRPRVLARVDGAERPLPLAKSCPSNTDLNALTVASTAADLLAVDIECQKRGAPPCTGARGNCGSVTLASVVVDATRGTSVPLATGFWPHAGVVMFSPDGTKLAVIGEASHDADLLDTKTGALVRRAPLFPTNRGMGGAGCAAWAPDGDRLYAVTGNAVVGVSARTGARTAQAEHPRLGDLAFGCTAKVFDGTLVVVSPSTSAIVRFRLPKLDSPEEHVFSLDGAFPVLAPDGRSVTLADHRGAALFDTVTWSLRSLPQASGVVTYDPTSTLVAVGRTVWNVHEARLAGALRSSF